MSASRAALAWGLLRAEGPRSLLERLRERRGEAARRARYRLGSLSELTQVAREMGPFPVLHLLPFPMRAGFGGVAVTLAARLEASLELGPVALLQRDPGLLRLELANGARRAAFHFPAPAPPEVSAPGLRPASAQSWREALTALVGGAGVRLLHFESVVGLPFGELGPSLRAVRYALAAHDFGLFCARPNLVERPAGRFCGFCRDLERCARCLAVDRPGSTPAKQASYREDAAGFAVAAAAIVYPSGFARRTHLELFPALRPGVQHVIPPASTLPRSDTLPGFTARFPPRHIAFVGQAAPHKGLPDFLAAATTVRTRHPEVRWSILGGGDPHALAAASRDGFRVLGYFRPGTLPTRLREHEIDLAVLPSRFPETHSLVLDECRAAGVPVLAADIGALGERTRELRAGWTFEPSARDAELTNAFESILGGSAPGTPESTAAAWTPLASADAHARLHGSLYTESGTT